MTLQRDTDRGRAIELIKRIFDCEKRKEHRDVEQKYTSLLEEVECIIDGRKWESSKPANQPSIHNQDCDRLRSFVHTIESLLVKDDHWASVKRRRRWIAKGREMKSANRKVDHSNSNLLWAMEMSRGESSRKDWWTNPLLLDNQNWNRSTTMQKRPYIRLLNLLDYQFPIWINQLDRWPLVWWRFQFAKVTTINISLNQNRPQTTCSSLPSLNDHSNNGNCVT